MREAHETQQIRTYNLFGETVELPDVVHCELIETRSLMHGWEFQPHRHQRLHQVLVVDAGGGTAQLRGKNRPLEAGWVVNVPRGAIHGYKFRVGTRGWVVTLTTDLVDQLVNPGEGVMHALREPALLPGTGEIRQVVEPLFAEFSGRSFGRAQLLRSLSGALLALVARQMMQTRPDFTPTAELPLFNRFEKAVEAHFRERRTIAEYASELAVSHTHLNRVVRQATGMPASRLVAERVLREARRMLTYTNLPVSQIAYELGYTDPAHFSRVFSKGAGLSPRAFREKTEKGL